VSYVGKISDAAVAVVADSVWGAMEGRRVLNVNWDDGPNKDLNSAAVLEALKQAAAKKGAVCIPWAMLQRLQGGGLRRNTSCRSWRTPRWSRGTAPRIIRARQCELWAPTQVPQDCRDSVAQAVGLDPDQVKVNVTLMGGGFGRRLEHDYAVERRWCRRLHRRR
jgi:isoquinoline 1-oxidoreductase subunit beta